MLEAERFFSGCRSAKGWLEDWRNLTGRCMTTVDAGYIGCVGAVKYNPGVGPCEYYLIPHLLKRQIQKQTDNAVAVQ